MKHLTLLASSALLLGAIVQPLFGKETSPDERLRNATTSLRELMGAPDKGVPRDLFEKARCVVIMPGLKKGAFIVGGEYGRGFASCRTARGGWTAPAAMRVEGGSWGLQIGGSSTDVLMLVMNEGGMKHLLGDKFKIGADATAALGPVGRQASADTDIALRAEILSWSRSRGVFAGISLDGSTLRPDNSENERIYGKNITNREILMGSQKIPAVGRPLTATLDRYSHEKVRRDARAGEGASARTSSAPRGTLVDKGEIYFDPGKSDLTADAQQSLNAVAQTLKDNAAWKIQIVGYTDTSGNKLSNLLLSKKRADTVKKYLVDQGVDGSRLTTTAGGEDTSGNGSNQRRVEIVRTNTDS
jgi:lipid-binding SYLF domain-containing protein